ncbi:MAG: glycoside hydrolase family 2, partial [Clostridium sp.]|nr:glycoside hydrolase family 2 [Clostridium sp.]
MKFLKSTIIACGIMASASSAWGHGPGFGRAELFNDGWRFSLSDDSLARNPQYVDDKWRKVSLPHDWSIEGIPSPTLASCQGYLPGGVAWYRKAFDASPSDGAKRYVYFEGVYNRSDVYINGHHLGHRPNGYVSFLYDLTPYLQEGENVLAVRVDHSRQADSRWYTGSGIYRDAYLVTAPQSHFDLWGTAWKTTEISDKSATVNVDTKISNTQPGQKVEAALYDAEGKKVASGQAKVTGGIANLSLKVKNPLRWDISSPYLYRLETRLLQDGREIDKNAETVGIRSLDFDPDKGFALNGRNIKVKGVCIHHDAGVLGAAVPKEVWKRRLLALKGIGVNALRMSHNPQAPALYDLCDELGLLVMDEVSDEWEFPKRKWVEGWNVGAPAFEGTYDFFEEWIEKDIADMVRRDRNHPCIFLWSIGNEVDYPNDPYSHPILDGDGSAISQPMYGGYDPKAPSAMRIGEIAKRLNACVKAVDDSRPTTGAMAGVVMSNQTEYPSAIDICGYNYTESQYAADHAAYPSRIIYGSETGVGYDQWKAVRDNDFIFGQFIWTGLDYLGESGRWPSRGLHTGLLDFTAQP